MSRLGEVALWLALLLAAWGGATAFAAARSGRADLRASARRAAVTVGLLAAVAVGVEMEGGAPLDSPPALLLTLSVLLALLSSAFVAAPLFRFPPAGDRSTARWTMGDVVPAEGMERHSCGFANPAGSRFCGGCGGPLAASAAAEGDG